MEFLRVFLIALFPTPRLFFLSSYPRETRINHMAREGEIKNSYFHWKGWDWAVFLNFGECSERAFNFVLSDSSGFRKSFPHQSSSAKTEEIINIIFICKYSSTYDYFDLWIFRLTTDILRIRKRCKIYVGPRLKLIYTLGDLFFHITL